MYMYYAPWDDDRRGVLAVYMTGVEDEGSYCKPKEIHKAEILPSNKYLASKFPT